MDSIHLLFLLLLIWNVGIDAQIQTFGQGGQNVNPNGGVNPNRVGQGSSAGVFGPRNRQGGLLPEQINFRNVKDIEWDQIDRRVLDGWTHLYPFGEMYHDTDLAGRPWNDKQIDLDFFFPYYGFRFNYTFIFPEGFIAFSWPRYIQPPYTFPNPRWPEEADMSFIAAFMAPQTIMYVGEHQISHLWFRVIHRPPNMVGNGMEARPDPNFNVQATRFRSGASSILNRDMPERYYRGQKLWTQEGRIEDPEFLNLLTRDIREGMIGTRGFTADYALVVTWERYAYGGAPKETRLNLYGQVRSWQNSYQMVIATDEIRSYVMFNYGHINWTSSTSAGALFGRGGKQSALVGFNGGNGTGFVQLPYSAEGNSYKLVQFGSTTTAGRWMARVDESIIYGGCTNTSTGRLRVDLPYIQMLGGLSVNVSGPCFRPGNVIMLQLDEMTVDCHRINMVVAKCVLPADTMYRTGVVDAKISIDGGNSYPFWTTVYLLMPSMQSFVRLINDPTDTNNNWRNPGANNLTLRWSSVNITENLNAQIDIELWGYWEDVEGHRFVKVGTIERGLPNRGRHSFDPRQIKREDMAYNSWKFFRGGIVKVVVRDHSWITDQGDGQYWSPMVPFGWYYKPTWEYHYGKSWALDICTEWFEWDGRRDNFFRDLETKASCPCRLSQALVDVGRFTPLWDCNMFGSSACYYTQGAQHCVVSTTTAWNGAGQMCCYDPRGYLMFGDDYEYNAQYLRFYSAGVTYRAHPWGSAPYKRPPYVPSFSNFYNDLLPFEFCCKWAAHCEFYFWRRQSSPCQNYRPSRMAIAYGDPHFVTFDGIKYSFQGKGYYVLSMMKSPTHNLMVQGRFEQPPNTIWNTYVPATIITGVAVQDNTSSVVQVFARKTFRRWRYRMDLYVDGNRIYQDKPFTKLLNFNGVSIYSPPRVMDMGEMVLMFKTGVGVQITENRGMLSVIVSLPPHYNATRAHPYGRPDLFGGSNGMTSGGQQGKCANWYRSLGLMGTWNDNPRDDLTAPDCTESTIQQPVPTPADLRKIYHDFGEKWKVDGSVHPLLFQSKFRPLYHPAHFAKKDFTPLYDIRDVTAETMSMESLIFTRDNVKVACQGLPSCEFDYVTTGRKEVALDTLRIEKQFESLKAKGEKIFISCGPLAKTKGVIKYPQSENYLDGNTVTFRCQPDYFLHGDDQRSCVNGTWTPGWWVWCRGRGLEIGLKWLTGIITFVVIALVIGCIFAWCWLVGKRRRKEQFGSREHFGAHGVADRPIMSEYNKEDEYAMRRSPTLIKPQFGSAPLAASPQPQMTGGDNSALGSRQQIPQPAIGQNNNYPVVQNYQPATSQF